MLADREAAYQKDKTVIKPTPAMYKNEYPYLKEVDSLALANVQLDLQEAYHRFFTVKGTGHPKFKSRKRSRNSYTTNNQNGTVAIDPEHNTIRLPKIERPRFPEIPKAIIIALFCLNIRMPLFLLSIRKTMRSGWTINPTDCIPIRKETSVDHLSIIARGRNV